MHRRPARADEKRPCQTAPSPPFRKLTDRQPSTCLGRIGALEVRLARERRRNRGRARGCGSRCSIEELGAIAPKCDAERRDADRFDDSLRPSARRRHALAGPNTADRRHLPAAARRKRRLQPAASIRAAEFELGALAARHPDLQLPRTRPLLRAAGLSHASARSSCCGRASGPISPHRIDVMAGCASFQGTVPARACRSAVLPAPQLPRDGDWDVARVARPLRAMDLMPAEAISMRAALAAMPPLIKGYLRLGARIGDGCVIDREFGTTDVFMVLPVRRFRRATSTITAQRPALRGLSRHVDLLFPIRADRLLVALARPPRPVRAPARYRRRSASSGLRPRLLRSAQDKLEHDREMVRAAGRQALHVASAGIRPNGRDGRAASASSG